MSDFFTIIFGFTACLSFVTMITLIFFKDFRKKIGLFFVIFLFSIILFYFSLMSALSKSTWGGWDPYEASLESAKEDYQNFMSLEKGDANEYFLDILQLNYEENQIRKTFILKYLNKKIDFLQFPIGLKTKVINELKKSITSYSEHDFFLNAEGNSNVRFFKDTCWTGTPNLLIKITDKYYFMNFCATNKKMIYGFSGIIDKTEKNLYFLNKYYYSDDISQWNDEGFSYCSPLIIPNADLWLKYKYMKLEALEFWYINRKDITKDLQEIIIDNGTETPKFFLENKLEKHKSKIKGILSFKSRS